MMLIRILVILSFLFNIEQKYKEAETHSIRALVPI